MMIAAKKGRKGSVVIDAVSLAPLERAAYRMAEDRDDFDFGDADEWGGPEGARRVLEAALDRDELAEVLNEAGADICHTDAECCGVDSETLADAVIAYLLQTKP
jgi:hypothetical protein